MEIVPEVLERHIAGFQAEIFPRLFAEGDLLGVRGGSVIMSGMMVPRDRCARRARPEPMPWGRFVRPRIPHPQRGRPEDVMQPTNFRSSSASIRKASSRFPTPGLRQMPKLSRRAPLDVISDAARQIKSEFL